MTAGKHLAITMWISAIMINVLTIDIQRQFSIAIEGQEEPMHSRVLFEDDEQRQRDRQNNQLFKNLRGGLENWPSNNHQRLRTKEQENIFSRDKKKYTKIGEGAWQGQLVPKAEQPAWQPQIDQEQLLKEAGLIDQEETEERHEQSEQKPKQNYLKESLYVAASLLSVFTLIKLIKTHCFADKPRIQPHQEQSESLANL